MDGPKFPEWFETEVGGFIFTFTRLGGDSNPPVYEITSWQVA